MVVVNAKMWVASGSGTKLNRTELKYRARWINKLQQSSLAYSEYDRRKPGYAA